MTGLEVSRVDDRTTVDQDEQVLVPSLRTKCSRISRMRANNSASTSAR